MLWDTEHPIYNRPSCRTAARFLAGTASKFIEALKNFDVKAVQPRGRSLDAIVVETDLRTLARQLCPWLNEADAISATIAKLDSARNLREEPMQLVKGRQKPHINAEVSMLQHFHEIQIPFMCDVRYISCSTPACHVHRHAFWRLRKPFISRQCLVEMVTVKERRRNTYPRLAADPACHAGADY